MMTINDDSRMVGSGIKNLDNLLQGLRLGDNVVWQVDNLNDYADFTESFVAQSINVGINILPAQLLVSGTQLRYYFTFTMLITRLIYTP